MLVLVAAPEGIAALEKAHPDVELYTAAIGASSLSFTVHSPYPTANSDTPCLFLRSIPTFIAMHCQKVADK
ncbi:uracil phosphoribosyltransferase [Vibrio cholerae]|nr:uracil phosphoribosyltransferase [Vibrio cholerae]